MKALIPAERIENKIYLIRGQKVMLDFDLANLYGATTKQLKRQVKRNLRRFPEDFLFYLTKEEYAFLRCQFGTLKRGAHAKYLPYAFTQEGVAMLSGVLNSVRAIMVNIQIMRVFSKFRQILSSHKELVDKLYQLERKTDRHDAEIRAIFKALRQLILPKEKKEYKIGFRPEG